MVHAPEGRSKPHPMAASWGAVAGVVLAALGLTLGLQGIDRLVPERYALKADTPVPIGIFEYTPPPGWQAVRGSRGVGGGGTNPGRLSQVAKGQATVVVMDTWALNATGAPQDSSSVNRAGLTGLRATISGAHTGTVAVLTRGEEAVVAVAHAPSAGPWEAEAAAMIESVQVRS